MSLNSMTRFPAGLAIAVAGILAAGAGRVAAARLAASLAPFCLTRMRRGLPEPERRFLIGLLVVALVLRVAWSPRKC